MEGVELEIRPCRAGRAIARKGGAQDGVRGLRPSWEHALIDTMYDLPGRASEKVVLDEHIIDDRR